MHQSFGFEHLEHLGRPEWEELHAEGERAMSWPRLLGVAALGVGTSVALFAAADTNVPAAMSMEVYRFGLSTSPTCENMTIYPLDAPQFVDFTTNPTLGSASVPEGTYHCVALEIEPTIKVTPKVDAGACDVNTTQSVDICAAFARIAGELDAGTGGNEVIDGWVRLGEDPSKRNTTCAAGDHVTIYLTTQVASGAQTNAFSPPASASDTKHGEPLGEPLVVGAKTTGTFVVGLQVVSTASNSCSLNNNPTFSFESSSDGP
jgi:hypothetical protein